MGVETLDELMAFFSASEFGEVATVVESAQQLPGFYDETHTPLSPGVVNAGTRSPVMMAAGEISTTSPVFVSPAILVAACGLLDGDTLLIPNRGRFRVVECQPDTDIVAIRLHFLDSQ